MRYWRIVPETLIACAVWAMILVPTLTWVTRSLVAGLALTAVFLAWSVLRPAWIEWRAWRIWWRWLRRDCIQCGYDLRASGDRCPECGAIQPK